VNRLVVTLTLVLYAAIGGQTPAEAKALTDPNIASGSFAENFGTRGRFHAPQPLDFAEEQITTDTKPCRIGVSGFIGLLLGRMVDVISTVSS
jgi:hypothetical protein